MVISANYGRKVNALYFLLKTFHLKLKTKGQTLFLLFLHQLPYTAICPFNRDNANTNCLNEDKSLEVVSDLCNGEQTCEVNINYLFLIVNHVFATNLGQYDKQLHLNFSDFGKE